MRTLSYLISMLLLLVNYTYMGAQPRDRNYIKKQISFHGECKNVAITKYNGDLMLYGDNGWAADGCPTDLTNALHELNEQGELIDDVQLTENGRWLILYGNNGIRWNNIPYSLEKKLRQWNSDGEVILSVSFNDAGDWIAISTNYISASNSNIQNWIAEGMDAYGGVWTSCVTDDAVVIVYENGYKSIGNIPISLDSELKSTHLNVYRLKIAGNAWFIADKSGNYSYDM